MQKRKLIVVKELSKGVESITKVDLQHDDIQVKHFSNYQNYALEKSFVYF